MIKFNLSDSRQPVKVAADLDIDNRAFEAQDADLRKGRGVPLPKARPSTEWAPDFETSENFVDQPNPRHNEAVQMRQQMEAWIQAKLANPATPPPDPSWGSDLQLEASKVVPLTMLFSVVRSAISRVHPDWPMNVRDKWIADNVRSVMPTSRVDTTVSKERRSKEIARGAEEQTPQAKAFVDNHIEEFRQTPKVQKLLGPMPEAEAIQVVGDAMYSAFGETDSGEQFSGRNDMIFFTTPHGWNFLPANIKQEVKTDPAVKDKLYLLLMTDRDRRSLGASGGASLSKEETKTTRRAVAANLSKHYPALSARLQAMSLYATGDPSDMAQAMQVDPTFSEVSDNFQPDAVKQAMFGWAAQQVNFRVMNMERRKKNVQRDERGGGSLNSAAPGSEQLSNLLPQESRFVPNPTASNATARKELFFEEEAKRLIPQLEEVATRIKSVGKDIASYMKAAIARRKSSDAINFKPTRQNETYWKQPNFQGRPSYPMRGNTYDKDGKLVGTSPERKAKAERMQVYVNALSRELTRLTTTSGRAELVNMLKRIGLRETGETSGVQMPDATINSHPDYAQVTADPKYATLAQKFNEYSPDPLHPDVSSTTRRMSGGNNGGNNENELSKLVSSPEFARLLQARVRGSMANYIFSRSQKDGTPITPDQAAQDAKIDMRQDFAEWAPFLLLDQVTRQYDVVTRRVLTDALPTRSEYMTGKGADHGKYALLFHAIRGEMNKAPLQYGYSGNPKNPEGGKTWHPKTALDFLENVQNVAKHNLGMKRIEKRWSKAEEAKQKLEQMRNSVPSQSGKMASVDTNYIDVLIGRFDRYLDRQQAMFFQSLRTW